MATVEELRQIALGLPETEETTSHGTPAFKVGGRLFLRERDPAGIWVLFVTDEGEKRSLLDSEPGAFFTTSHYDGHPSVLLRLPAVDREELTELITDAWLARAPARIRRAYRADRP